MFEFVRDELAASRPALTLRETAAAFGWKSKRAAACHIEEIIRKVWLAVEAGKARSLRLSKSLPEVAEIPLPGVISAGFGSEQSQQDDEYIPVAIESIGFTPTRNTFALRVVGDSMVGEHICVKGFLIMA